MTQKDIRDIAAYWGAPIFYTIQAGNDPWEEDRANGSTRYGKEEFQGTVGIAAMDGICLWWTAQRVVNVKLQLRQIRSLTDDEVRNIVEIAEEDNNKEIHRFETRIESGSISIDWHQKEFIYLNYGDHSDDAVKNPAAIIGYLQSIGVYVPGMIDPQYVELLP